MNKKHIQLFLFITTCLLVVQVLPAQPPPPHPGGSGNQGAAIDHSDVLLLLAGVSLVIYNFIKKFLIKEQQETAKVSLNLRK